MTCFTPVAVAAEDVRGAAARQVTPAGQDADRPAWSADGTRIAFVRAGASGEEIWEIPLEAGDPRKRLGPEELKRVGLSAAGYSLHDLAWSPSGDRLAFTWYDGREWGQITLSDPNGALVPLAAPVLPALLNDAPWEEGAAFNLSASRFLWDEGGTSGTFVAWDEDCGTLYRAKVPEPGTWGGTSVSAPESKGIFPERLPSPPGCHPLLLGTGVPIGSRRLWLETGLDEGSSQSLVVADGAGAIVDEIVFPQGRPLRVSWGSATTPSNLDSGRPRPPIAGWWYDADTRARVLFVWESGSLLEWRREPCAEDCADPVALTGEGLFYLEGPPGAASLMLMPMAGATPIEILPPFVAGLVPSPDGRRLLVIRVEDSRRGIWLLGDAARPAP